MEYINTYAKFDLKRFRKANKLSQLELANILGVTQSFISKVEKGIAPLPDSIRDLIFDKTDWKVPADIIALAEIKEKGDIIEQNGGHGNIGKIDGSGEVAFLQEKVKLLEQLLEEKERTIQILMK